MKTLRNWRMSAHAGLGAPGGANLRARAATSDVSLQTTYLVCFSEFVPSNPIAMAEAGGDAHVKYVEPTYLMRPYEEKKCVCAAVFAL